jgi:hypothetical protein
LPEVTSAIFVQGDDDSDIGIGLQVIEHGEPMSIFFLAEALRRRRRR